MPRKGLLKLVTNAKNKTVNYADDFLVGLIYTIEQEAKKDKHMPSPTFSPSGMKCERSMIYKLLSVPPDDKKESYQLISICENGTERHQAIQSYVNKMKSNGVDCEYINVADYVREHKLPLFIGKESNFVDEFETHLYTFDKKVGVGPYSIFPYPVSFLCDGVIKLKGKYFILEIKTQASTKAMRQKDVHEEHKAQATAYSLLLGIDDVMFLYEDRDLLGKKCFVYTPTDDEKVALHKKLHKCYNMSKENKVVAKPVEASTNKKLCLYCPYLKTCRNGGEGEYVYES